MAENLQQIDQENDQTNLIGLSYTDFEQEITTLGEAKFRAKQLWHWIYHHGVHDFADIKNMSKEFKNKLSAKYILKRPEIFRQQISNDGTRKWLFKFHDGEKAEVVYIPEDGRGTLCVSSQVGCTLTCKFCHTGTQKLVRNLTSYEIVTQIMLARDVLEEWPTPSENRKISNIVFMGMGEPLYNYDNVKQALEIIMAGDGLAFSRRKITLSTSGVVPMIEKCGRELGVNLAISLHATTDEARNILVPINKKYNIEELLRACRNYYGDRHARRITFEYVMLAGVNDSDIDARRLIKLIKKIPAKVNLIPFNPWPGSEFICSSPERINDFADIITNAGYASPVRTPRGRDILAACGQLKSDSERKSKSILKNLEDFMEDSIGANETTDSSSVTEAAS